MNNNNKTVLITGASSGIGKALALLYAREPYNLILTGRDHNNLQEVQKLCKQAGCQNTIIINADLSKNYIELYEKVTSNNLTVDILINNAGFSDYGDFACQNLEKLIAMINLNIIGLISLTRLFIPHMQQNKSGQIIFISSVYAYAPIPKQAVYAATKSFVKSFALALHDEVSRFGIYVGCAYPGSTASQFQTRAGITSHSNRLKKSSQEVALTIKKGIEKKKTIIIPGWYNRVFTSFCALTPHKLLLKFIHLIIYRSRGIRSIN